MAEDREHERIDAELVRAQPGSDPFAAAVRATRMPMLITEPNRPDNPIVFVNDAFSRLTGYDRAEILGRNCRFLQGPGTEGGDIARIRDAIEQRVPIEIELLNYKKDGERFWNRLLISPVFDSSGALTYFAASQFDVTLEREQLLRLQHDKDALEAEVERRAHDLSRSEERLHLTLKTARLGTWKLDIAERRLLCSEVCRDNYGRGPDEPFSYDDLIAAIAPEDRPRTLAAVEASIRQHRDYDIEYRVVTPKGAIRWVQVRGQPFFRADGEPLTMVGISADITDRKVAEEHRALLAAELNHRVKNTMATIQSFTRQTLRAGGSIEEMRDKLDARLHSLASAHEVLMRDSWEGATLSELVDETLKPFRSGAGRRIIAGGPRIRVPPRIGLAIIMALHELATNAVKYGALSSDKGRVILNWDTVDGSAPHRFWLRWEEIGGPIVLQPTRTGFGSRLIERALARELGGTADVDYRSTGVVFTVEAPLPDARDTGAA